MPTISRGLLVAHPPAVATCISCGAPWGQPHYPGCKFGTLTVLTVLTVKSGLGVAILTLCPRCATFDQDIPVSVGTATRLVVQHLEHVRGVR